jgi:hypothetical protein
MASSLSPTQRTLAYLREEGYTCAIVERWNPFAKIRQDLFGFIDILAIKKDETLAVQCTSTGVAARMKKIQESEYLPKVRDAGWKILIIGWSKNSKGRYVMRRLDIS